jgi:serine/threonine protein kinase
VTDKPIGRGTVLAGRFRLEDLVQDTDGARFWRAIDQTLARSVAVNVIDTADPRAEALLVAARTSATITEGHFLRVLDAAQEDGFVYVVHEWGNGMSLDKMLADGPLPTRRAAWLVKEVADAITFAHSHGIAHGRLVPENVMVTEAGSVKLIGFVVDAVLHGRQPSTPDGRILSDHESDVYNLAALLYATLAGKWPGTQPTALPEAPRDHERTLRPRQVRAGVPRDLDAICDRVLNPGSPHGTLETAHEIGAALSDFIGDAAAAPPVGHEPTMAIDQDELARFQPSTGSQQPATGPVGAGGAAQASPSPGAAPSTDPEATQAAEPMFDEEFPGPRRVSPPPPPPLPEPEPKPLFAPGPPRATQQRTYDDPSGPVRGMHSTHGTGSLPAVWGPDAVPDAEEGQGWGSRDSSVDWLKLAGALAVIVALVLAIIFAFNLGRGTGGSPPAEEQQDEETAQTDAPAEPLSIAGVTDLDPPPEGNGEENPQLTGLAIDGDPSTAWQTMTYYGNPQLGLLKDGVGLVVDLGSPEEVSSVLVTLQGSPTSLEILAAPEGSGQPENVDDLRRVAAAEGVGGRTNLQLEEPVTTQYLVVWLTSLPPTDDGYRGRIAEIVVRP